MLPWVEVLPANIGTKWRLHSSASEERVSVCEHVCECVCVCVSVCVRERQREMYYC